MNVRIPTAEAIKIIEKRIKEIEEAHNRYNQQKAETEIEMEAYKKAVIAYAKKHISKAEINHFYRRDQLSFTLDLPPEIVSLYPKNKPKIEFPKGDLEELRSTLKLLRLTTSTEVSTRTIKGIMEAM